jgi:large subunit ribosomal protein L38e
MPVEIADAEKFIQVSERASVCRVKRLQDTVKLKLRTRKALYTIKVDPEKAAELIKQIKCEIVEA